MLLKQMSQKILEFPEHWCCCGQGAYNPRNVAELLQGL